MTLHRHLGGYALSGLLQWALEYTLVLALSHWLLPIAAANVIGRVCGALLGFWINGRWTFVGEDHQTGRRAASRFLLTWCALTVVNTACVGAVAHISGLRSAQMSKPVFDLATAAMGFLLSRHWIYRR